MTYLYSIIAEDCELSMCTMCMCRISMLSDNYT